jgi:eukaryotic-like serine/threonine-protein kinase
VKVVRPHLPSSIPGTSGVRDSRVASSRLPDDLISEQVRRLAIFAVVGAALWGYGFLQDAVLLPATPRPPAWAKMHVPVEIFGIVMSAAMFVYVRYAAHSAQTKIHVGLGYMILSTALVAYFNTWVSSATEAQINQLSWNTLAILVSSMILPVPPRRMLAASLVAASTDPLGVWLAHLSGMPVPSVTQTLLLYLPNYVCAAIAMLPSSVLHGLGRRLREAQALGSYRLVELLGHGGMGEVWRAEHLLLARSVAIKLVRPEVLGAATPEEARLVLQRFQREARATAALSSPHTIQLFDYGMTDEGTFYYAMELLAGRDLETLVREFGPLPADRVIFLLRQVCHSLADAHARGLVHRDIKPANIYVCRMGQEYDFVKVLDFGLVKFKDTRNAPLTVRGYGQTTGTPAYMAPEIALGERDVDRRADVYALGCVAYYLLTGQLVFEADTSMKMLLQHVQDKPVPPSSRTELRIPRELDDLVLSCLEKDPNKRPQNAEVLYEIACRATTCASWDRAAAQTWWTTHLPDLTGPLTIDLGKDTQEILESAAPDGQPGPKLAAGASAWPNPRT